MPRMPFFFFFIGLSSFFAWEIIGYRIWSKSEFSVAPMMLMAHFFGILLAFCLAYLDFSIRKTVCTKKDTFSSSPSSRPAQLGTMPALYGAAFFWWASGAGALLYLLAARDSAYSEHFLYTAAFMSGLPLPVFLRFFMLPHYAGRLLGAAFALGLCLFLFSGMSAIPYGILALIQCICNISAGFIFLWGSKTARYHPEIFPLSSALSCFMLLGFFECLTVALVLLYERLPLAG